MKLISYALCYVFGKGYRMNKTNIYLERRIKVKYYSKQVIECRLYSFFNQLGYLLYVPPTRQVWHKTFLGESRRRVVA